VEIGRDIVGGEAFCCHEIECNQFSKPFLSLTSLLPSFPFDEAVGKNGSFFFGVFNIVSSGDDIFDLGFRWYTSVIKRLKRHGRVGPDLIWDGVQCRKDGAPFLEQ